MWKCHLKNGKRGGKRGGNLKKEKRGEKGEGMNETERLLFHDTTN